MGRHSRRLHVRLARATAAVAAGAFAYQRWQLRSFGTQPASAYSPATSPAVSSEHTAASPHPAPRALRWAQLQTTSPEKPFDVLVIGGGLTGLYTAVDAAQRGLSVALVEAGDIGGGGTTSNMPTLSPGAFPFVQRAIRQRDTDWLRLALSTLCEETTWCNVAHDCVVVPDTLWGRCQRSWRRMQQRLTSSSEANSSGSGERGVADTALLSRPPTTLLPAVHSSEMAEYTCAAVLSTLLSFFCGPLRPNGILTASAVEARLPALAPCSNSAASAATATVRVKGAVVSNDFLLKSNSAATALALTAEELGVVLLSYAPVCAIEEQTRSAPSVSERRMNSIMVAQVRDALARDSRAAVHESSPSKPFFSRWRGRGVMEEDSPTPALNHSDSPSTEQRASTVASVHAYCIVNCTGCWVDTVKALYDGNARDTVPAAFAGYHAYSYLVAPGTALHAAPHTVSSPAGAGSAGNDPQGGAPSAISAEPLSASTRTAGLHFSSPRLSFASAMVLPWWEGCVLLGPSISPLPPHLAMQPEMTGAGPLMLQSKDGFAGQQVRIASMLASCGVSVELSRVLSCISQIVPYMKSPKEVPFQSQLLKRGYALHFSSLPASDDGSAGKADLAASTMNGQPDEARRDVAFLHVYGGTPVMARRIAEDVVNALLQHPVLSALLTSPTSNRDEPARHIHGCRTRRLSLTSPASLALAPAAAPQTSETAATPDPVTRLQALIEETYAERLVDVVARRTHVLYSSPDDALRALPFLASVMGRVKGWTAARERAEVEAAQRLVASVAVTPTANTTTT